ncbi:MAG: bifunctional phosphoribosyl-AMP cyclohydrolase/phosphoribosyl-ATP diphosphatase HisIE [Bacteroidetes bacterium]|nr:MAG: bifunctional phosphoribosyl-AMP cyclohydrolase/phosphoribosyl-ATP diphosphatase HisIE [Bacteroidota bacterium]
MEVNFTKSADGLIPAIVQDAKTLVILMCGFMNASALEETQKSKKVTFFSRSKNRLWTKGETSGNFLMVESIKSDCDNDTLLIKANPIGPACHTGADTCWFEPNKNPIETNEDYVFLENLASTIKKRHLEPDEKSYTSSLFKKGINKIAQKVGEEAVEIVIEAKDDNKELFLGEAADLLFHYMVLLEAKNFSLHDVIAELKKRHKIN